MLEGAGFFGTIAIAIVVMLVVAFTSLAAAMTLHMIIKAIKEYCDERKEKKKDVR